MDAGANNEITLVLPTYNRASALRANLGMMLELSGVSEVIVVNDGSTDDTLEVCAQFNDPRLKIVTHPVNLGVAAARNTGIEAAGGDWILFGEDDCRFPSSYASALLAEALSHDADLAGAPLLHKRTSDQDIHKVAACAPRSERPSMDDVGTFPTHTIETPFIPARALIRASVFDAVRFYEGFPVNGYREETDFFVQAARAGFRCIFTPATFCYQVNTWSGGQHHSSSIRYEYWVLRNNWHFIRRHRTWLVEHGFIRGAVRAQLRFCMQRARSVAFGVVRARLLKLSGKLSGQGEREPTPGAPG